MIDLHKTSKTCLLTFVLGGIPARVHPINGDEVALRERNPRPCDRSFEKVFSFNTGTYYPCITDEESRVQGKTQGHNMGDQQVKSCTANPKACSTSMVPRHSSACQGHVDSLSFSFIPCDPAHISFSHRQTSFKTVARKTGEGTGDIQTHASGHWHLLTHCHQLHRPSAPETEFQYCGGIAGIYCK